MGAKLLRIIFLLIILVGLGGIFVLFNQKSSWVEKINLNPESNQGLTDSSNNLTFASPIAGFEKRITKKSFGILISPENSPVQPERFSGYHTGVDVEYEDVAEQVSVLAIKEGEIVLADWVAGYGGVIVLKFSFNQQEIYALYGHLDPQSFTSKTFVDQGEKIGTLGQGQTKATDFERKHLHFGLKKGGIDLHGYVETEDELNSWYDPQLFF